MTDELLPFDEHEDGIETLRPDPIFLAYAMKEEGHRLLKKGDSLHVTNASSISPEDKAIIKAMKAELLPYAAPWVEPPAKPTSMAQFLSLQAPELPPDWRPKEFPNLSGVKNIIYNHATTGLQWWKDGVEAVGLSIATLDGQSWFFPTRFAGAGNLPEDKVIQYVKDQIKGMHIHNSNTGFDMHMSRKSWNIDLEAQGNTFTDILHTAALLDDTPFKPINLDALAKEYLGELSIARLDEAAHADYAAYEAASREEYTVQLVARLVAKMYPLIEAQDLRRVHHLEDRVLPAIVEMERNGAPMDLELLADYTRRCHQEQDKLMLAVIRECGFAFNLSNQSWQRLFEKYHLPVSYTKALEEGKDDKATFKDEVIASIDHPVIQMARKAKHYRDLASKTFDAYPALIDKHGILRYRINQLRGDPTEGGGGGGTITGRTSASPIQQVPNAGNHRAMFGKEMDLFPRKLYVAGPDALNYMAADAMQVQYRIFAHAVKNPKQLEAYRQDPLTSFHKLIHNTILPMKPDMIYEHVKTLNFLKIFGGKLIKMALALDLINPVEAAEIKAAKAWDNPRLDIAKKVDEIYNREIPEVEPILKLATHFYMRECDFTCKRPYDMDSWEWHDKYDSKEYPGGHRGFVTTVAGRRCRSHGNLRNYKAFCMYDQGSEGDIVKTKIADLHEARKETGFRMRMVVHDELTGDAMTPETLEKVMVILNHQSFPELRVPILWEGKSGRSWADCK